MICFTPKRFINWLPRWIELLIIPIPYVFVVFILCELGIFDIIFYKTMNGNNSDLIFCACCYILIIFDCIYPSSTILNKIVIDYESKTIIIWYSKYYFLSKKRIVAFDDFSFSYYDTIGFNSLNFKSNYKVKGVRYQYESVKIFNNNKKVAKLISRNGWKKVIVNTVIEEFNKIAPTEKSTEKYL